MSLLQQTLKIKASNAMALVNGFGNKKIGLESGKNLQSIEDTQVG